MTWAKIKLGSLQNALINSPKQWYFFSKQPMDSSLVFSENIESIARKHFILTNQVVTVYIKDHFSFVLEDSIQASYSTYLEK